MLRGGEGWPFEVAHGADRLSCWRAYLGPTIHRPGVCVAVRTDSTPVPTGNTGGLLSAAQFSQVAALVAKGLPSVAFGTCPAVQLELAPWSSLGGSPGGCERMLLASLFSHSSS